MLVSVIIPVFNREKTIGRAVESVLAQTYRDIELIVVDDGSQDNTIDVLTHFGSRLRLITQKNAGPSAARNTGIKASSGEIVAFLDSDDSWLPEKIEKQVRLMSPNGDAQICCCVCNASMVHTDGRTFTSFEVAALTPHHTDGIWMNPGEVLSTRFLLFNQVVAVRRNVLDQVGYFPEGRRILEDYDLALRLSVAGAWAFTCEPLVVWYGGASNSLSSSINSAELPRINYEILSAFCLTPAASSIKSARSVRRRLFILKSQVEAQTLSHQVSMRNRVLGAIWMKSLRLYETMFNRKFFLPGMKTVRRLSELPHSP